MGHFIEFEEVSYTYPGAETPSVSNVSFTVERGDIVLITGPSGAGKTTLCSMLNRMVPESYGGTIEGRISIGGSDISQYSMGQMAFVSGMLFQDPSGQLISPTVADEIAFGPENKGLTIDEINKLVEKYISYINMNHLYQRPPQALSGGQQQSVAYAAVLAMEPEIYVLDEPTSNLDPLGSDLVFKLISKVVNDKKKTAILVEHKLDKVINIVNRVIVLDKGRVVFNGTPSEVLSHHAELLEIGVVIPQVTQFFSELSSKGWTELVPTTDLDQGVFQLKEALAQKSLSVERMTDVATQFTQSRVYQEPVIEVKGVRFAYNPETEVLHGVDLNIYRGEFVSIVGQNGSGKTTIVKHFNGLLKPTAGSVVVMGNDTQTMTVSQLSEKVGYCFQNPDHQIFSSVVRDEIAYGPRNLRWSQETINESVDEVGQILRIKDLYTENPYNLSKGQRQQIAVAAILAMKPEIVIVDEPTTGQDPRQSREMMDMVRWLNRELHKTIIVITHDMSIAAEYSDRIIVMHSGSVIASGTPREIFAQEELLNSTNLEPPQVTRLLLRSGLVAPIAIDVAEAVALLSTAQGIEDGGEQS